MTLFSQLVPNASLVTANSTQTLTNKTLNSPILVTPSLGVASANSITANLGAVGTPSYTFTGDTNTGMWSPAADTLAFSEGGAEAMRIDSSGNVGIGTTAPTSKLVVKRDANSTAVSDSASIVLSNRNTAISGAIMGGVFADTYRDVADPSYTGGVWFTRVQQAGNLASSSEIVFGTAASGSTALPTERMRIDTAGNVGIGTTTPNAKLHVEGGSVRSSVSLIVSGAGSMQTSIAGSGLALNSSSTNGISIETGATPTERMRITNAGNVGIGTTAPLTQLNVPATILVTSDGGYYGGGAYYASVAWRNAVAGQGGYAIRNTAGVFTIFTGASTAVVGTAFTSFAERMRIDGTGNVGIGTSSPSYKLDVSSSGTTLARYTGAQYSQVQHSDGTRALYTQVYDNVAVLGTATSTPLTFAPNNTERMRLDASGNLGIGTASPGYKLDVSATGNISGQFKTSGSINALFLADAGTTAETLYIGTVGNDFRVVTGSNERMRITSAGDVGIGVTNPGGYRLRLDSGTSDKLRLYNSVGNGNTIDFTDQGWQSQLIGTAGNILFNTGGTTERMRITNTGEVGIGTTAPSARLSLSSFSDGVFATIGYGGGSYAGIGGTLSNGGGNTTGTLQFYTRTATGDASLSEKMRLTAAGDVGIGTTVPVAKLHVVGKIIGVADGTYSSVGAYGFRFSTSTNADRVLWGGYDNALNAGFIQATELDIAHTSLLLNPNGGNVGIGTTTPGSALTVARGASSGAEVAIQANGNLAAAQVVLSQDPGSAAYLFNRANQFMSFGTNNTERMRIDSVGNVRIGSSSGGAKLSVVSTLSTNLLIEKNSLSEAYNPGTFSSKNAYMPSGTQENWVSASSASTVAGYLVDITAYNGGSATDVYFGALAGPVVGAGGPANFVFGRRTGTQTWAETMRIDNVGNVGIGTTAPGYKLSVAGTLEVTAVKEGVFTITDGAINLDPNNGSIQLWTLGASRTPGQVNWATGQSITLMIDDGAAYAVTWATLAVVWKTNGGTAPTLNTSGFTIITLWKVGTTIYGARVGDA